MSGFQQKVTSHTKTQKHSWKKESLRTKLRVRVWGIIRIGLLRV